VERGVSEERVEHYYLSSYQLMICVFQQQLKWRQVWWIESTSLASAKKCINSLSVCCRDKAAPRCGRVKYLGNDNRPEDSHVRPASHKPWFRSTPRGTNKRQLNHRYNVGL